VPLFATGIIETSGGKFTAGVVDTGGKFVTGVAERKPEANNPVTLSL
jgi:hypothetical protein